MTLKIGLTGGIGSGKSTVAAYFAKFKIPIVDADVIVHELFTSSATIYKKIVIHFGRNVLTASKALDRSKLRAKIFADPQERLWIEKILHPIVRRIMLQRVAKLQDPYCIMVIPLLFETKFPIKVDRILVIDCPKKIQIIRLQRRGFTDLDQINNIIKIQASRDLRIRNAHDIIKNNKTPRVLKKEIEKLHDYYLSLI
ncbi:MAG: dephospho-CoA kinase [Coxiellaceae bacterium]|jgi:dephospho-CoA kinase|nr:dephospho-CoA kinase [Coxiellaceae bacterium]